MFNTFNMGVGMSVIVSEQDADEALRILAQNGQEAYVIGSVCEGRDKVELV